MQRLGRRVLLLLLVCFAYSGRCERSLRHDDSTPTDDGSEAAVQDEASQPALSSPNAVSAKVRLRSGNTPTAQAVAAHKREKPVLFVRAALWKKYASKWGFRDQKAQGKRLLVVRSNPQDMIPPEAVGHSYILLRSPARYPQISEELNPVTRKEVVITSRKRRRVILHRSRHNRFEAFPHLPSGYFNVAPVSALKALRQRWKNAQEMEGADSAVHRAKAGGNVKTMKSRHLRSVNRQHDPRD